MNLIKPKLHNILFILLLISSCSSEKFLTKGNNLLSDNKIFINGSERKSDPINELLLPKPNTYFFGVPIKLQLNSWAKEFPKDNFKKWLNTKENRSKNLNKLISPKQVYQLERYYVKFNSWLKKNGEKPSLVDSLLIKKNLKKLI